LLAPGDELLSVNGTILKGYSVEEAYEVLENVTSGDIVCCVARNNGGLNELENNYFRQ